MEFRILKFSKFKKIRDSSFISLLILLHVIFKPIDRNIKTFVAVLKLMDHNVTLTPFVADLSLTLSLTYHWPTLDFQFFTKCVKLMQKMALKV